MTLPYTSYGYKGSLGALPLQSGPNIPFFYKVDVPAVGNVLTLQEVKDHLKITTNDEDTYLLFLIAAAENFAQDYMHIVFLETTFKTFRDFFNPFFILKRRPFISVESVEYLKDSIFTLIPSTDYSILEDKVFSSIYRNPNSQWPSDKDNLLQSIRIFFKAGFGTADDVPNDIKMGLLQHIAFLYAERGDCDECACERNLPSQTRLIYNLYKIMDVGVTAQIG